MYVQILCIRSLVTGLYFLNWRIKALKKCLAQLGSTKLCLWGKIKLHLVREILLKQLKILLSLYVAIA